MVHTVSNLLCFLSSPIQGCSRAFVAHDLLQHLVDDLGLLHRLLAVCLSLLKKVYDQHSNLLVLFVADFYFLFALLLAWLLSGLMLRSPQLGLHPKEVIASCSCQALGLLYLTAFRDLLVYLLLILLELDVVLHDVDVRGLEKAADFAHIGRANDRVGVKARHGLRQPDERLELAHGVAVALRTARACRRLSHLLELVSQDSC